MMLMMLCCIRYYVKISQVKFIHIFRDTLCFQCNLFLKFLPLVIFFYPFATIFVVEFRNCEKYQQSSQILEMLPKSEMQFQIRKRLQIPKSLESIIALQSDYGTAVYRFSDIFYICFLIMPDWLFKGSLITISKINSCISYLMMAIFQ